MFACQDCESNTNQTFFCALFFQVFARKIKMENCAYQVRLRHKRRRRFPANGNENLVVRIVRPAPVLVLLLCGFYDLAL